MKGAMNMRILLATALILSIRGVQQAIQDPRDHPVRRPTGAKGDLVRRAIPEAKDLRVTLPSRHPLAVYDLHSKLGCCSASPSRMEGER